MSDIYKGLSNVINIFKSVSNLVNIYSFYNYIILLWETFLFTWDKNLCVGKSQLRTKNNSEPFNVSLKLI